MTFADLIYQVVDLILLIVPIVVGIAVLGFMWGVFQLVFNAGNAEKAAEGRKIIIWGIIVLFVMLSVGGIVRVLRETFFF